MVYLVTWSIDPRDHILFARVYGTVCLCVYRIIVNKGFKIRFRSISILPKPNKKELKTCHKLWFSNPEVIATWCYTPLIYQSFNSVLSKVDRVCTLGCKDEKIRFLKKKNQSKLIFSETCLCSVLKFVGNFLSSPDKKIYQIFFIFCLLRLKINWSKLLSLKLAKLHHIHLSFTFIKFY